MNNEQVLHDFRRRYEGTYVHLEIHSEGTEVLAKVAAVESNSSKIGVLHLDTREYGSLKLNLGSDGHTLKFKYPPVGVFQNGPNASVFYRRPQRQYRRGLCSDNSFVSNVARYLGGNSGGIDFNSLSNAFRHQYYSMPEAIELLSKMRCRSVALPDNLSLMLSPTEQVDQYLVLHYQHPIAKTNLKGKATQVYEKVFTDLLDKHLML